MSKAVGPFKDTLIKSAKIVKNKGASPNDEAPLNGRLREK